MHSQEQAPSSDDNSPLSTFLSLLPGPSTNDEFKIPLPPSMRFSTSLEYAKSLYSRCGNNNFAIHSHLTTIGHGVFPLASRLFNHSCYPNAAPKYKFTPTGVVMEVVALREIAQDEEICIPYLDPAMLQTRQQIFRYTYGFKCSCPSCVELEGFDVISPPSNSDELGGVASLLKAFVGLDKPFVTLPTKPGGTIPSNLHCIFHEAYLSQLSESFSKASHGSQYDTAVEAGVTLLAAYILIYPPNYPQIGVHLLELAKTAWNKFVSSEIQDPEGAFGAKQQARMFLNAGHQILRIYGEEGDKEGPLSEAATLWSHLESQLIAS
ncbi:hypothetical protein H0H93_012781 [Arthromyces matolae]|nr:hypothetical protein H0H93_012781 [Arthromyces matolae]